MDRQPLKLGQLPVEILAEIVHHVDREKDLLSLCRVSRLFSHLAERDLYANVHVRLCPNAARLRLALRSRPERLKFVRNAWLHSMNSTKIKGFWTSYMFCPLLAACQNLETLELASKHAHQSDLMTMDMETLHDDLLYYQHDLYDMFSRIGLHTPRSERVLPALTTLRLHFQKLGYRPEWELGSSLVHIFFSPTLREISLVRCTLVQDDSTLLESMQLDQFQRATPLETLRLWYCIPRADVLQSIFSLPRRLKCFQLEPYIGSRPPITQSEIFRDLEAWTNVFMQQKDSLEEMVLLADTSALESPNGCLDLRAMEKVNLFAGDIFQTDRESVKINDAKVLSSPGYYRMLDETCPAWDQWTEVDEDLLRFERLERQEFQYDITRSPEVGRIYDISDLDDMLFEDDFDGMDEDDWM